MLTGFAVTRSVLPSGAAPIRLVFASVVVVVLLGIVGVVVWNKAEQSRAEELERRIGVRLRASEIAGRAQERMRAKAVPKTLQNARTLLPIVTGDRYFDLRFAGSGGVELWDEAAAEELFGALRRGDAVTVAP